MTKKIILSFFIATIFIGATVVRKKLIRWNFEDHNKLTYKYTQVMLNDIPFFEKQQKMEMTANLIVKIKDKEHADVIFTNIKMITEVPDSTGKYMPKDTLEMPNQVLFQDLKPDGEVDGNIEQSSIMLARTLFPITNQKMKLGESFDLKMSVPFNMFGSRINVKGFNRVKYESSDNKIERLSTIIDVSEYTIPEEIDREYVCFVKGNSDFNFNSEEGIFRDGMVKIHMLMGVEDKDSIITNKNTKMIMNMNTEIKFELLKIE